MCGLGGMAGDLDKKDRDFFKLLLQVNVMRGHHSTGVASANYKGETAVFKRAVNAYDLIQHRNYDDVVDWSAQVLLGHNRWATVGAINNLTAHPFEHGSLIGAHNGTLRNWKAALEDAEQFDTDSEALIYNLAINGWEKTFKKLDGAWALTVYDQDTHTLNIIRNEERPLWIGYREDHGAVYWASEKWMLKEMAAKAGVKLAKNLFQPKENRLLSFDLPEVRQKKIPKPEGKVLEVAPEKKPHTQYPGEANGYGRGNIISIRGSKKDSPLSQQLGASLGDWVTFIPTDITKSGLSNSYVYLEGYMPKAPYSDVKCYMEADKADYLLEVTDLLCGQVCGLIPEYKNGGVRIEQPFISLTSSSLFVPYDEDGGEETEFETVVQGPGSSLLNEEEFNKAVSEGCSNCTRPLEFNKDEVKWYADYPVCVDCMKELD